MSLWVSTLTSITMVILAFALFDDADDDDDGGTLIPAYQTSQR